VDIANSDFRLRSSSLYRTGGENLGYTRDLDGIPVPADPSLGASQWVSPGVDDSPIYYISSSGDDSDTGRSEGSSWATLGPVNLVIFRQTLESGSVEGIPSLDRSGSA